VGDGVLVAVGVMVLVGMLIAGGTGAVGVALAAIWTVGTTA
jgi:hypothetical protein